MREAPNRYIDKLDGYLLCLSRLCGSTYSFGASSYLAETDVDAFAREVVAVLNEKDEYSPPDKFIYLGKSVIAYTELKAEIANYILNGPLRPEALFGSARDETARFLLWDIIEYYGLASTTMNPDGAFHPPISSTVHRLDIASEDYEHSLFFVVPVENMYVLTRLCKLKRDLQL